MKIIITTGEWVGHYDAPTGRAAVQMFFDDVRDGKIVVKELGALGEWTDGRESYPFRIVPALVRCGFLTHSQMRNLLKLAGLSFTPSELADMVKADAWMVRAKLGH